MLRIECLRLMRQSRAVLALLRALHTSKIVKTDMMISDQSSVLSFMAPGNPAAIKARAHSYLQDSSNMRSVLLHTFHPVSAGLAM